MQDVVLRTWTHGTSLTARIAAGRYFLGDPGMAMPIGDYPTIVEAKGDARHALFDVDGAAVLLVQTRQGTYPNSGMLNLSAYDCDSGHLGLVHESLLIQSRDLSYSGSMIRISDGGSIEIEDDLFRVADMWHANLVRIETIANRTGRALPQERRIAA